MVTEFFIFFHGGDSMDPDGSSTRYLHDGFLEIELFALMLRFGLSASHTSIPLALYCNN